MRLEKADRTTTNEGKWSQKKEKKKIKEEGEEGKKEKKKKKKKKEKEKEKIPHMCESIGLRPLWGRCPKGM